MLRAILVVSLAISAAAGGIAQQLEGRPSQKLTLAPTPLEAMAGKADAITVYSKFVGRLEPGDIGRAWAHVYAVVVESPSSTPARMRGVRIDLRHEGAKPQCWLHHLEWSVLCDREQAAAFIEENRLPAFRDAVIAGNAEIHPGQPFGVTTFSSSGGSGILIGGYTFPGKQLTDVEALLAVAAIELGKAPR